jgi:hypothetical protein
MHKKYFHRLLIFRYVLAWLAFQNILLLTRMMSYPPSVIPLNKTDDGGKVGGGSHHCRMEATPVGEGLKIVTVPLFNGTCVS